MTLAPHQPLPLLYFSTSPTSSLSSSLPFTNSAVWSKALQDSYIYIYNIVEWTSGKDEELAILFHLLPSRDHLCGLVCRRCTQPIPPGFSLWSCNLFLSGMEEDELVWFYSFEEYVVEYPKSWIQIGEARLLFLVYE